MKVLMVHARYRRPGGEDVSVATEARALAALGVEVDLWTLPAETVAGPAAFARAAWNRAAVAELVRRVRQRRPDVIHVQNFFPGLSPAVHRAAARLGIPVAQSVRNWRLVCPAATRFRAGQVCDACVERPLAWPALGRPCWRGQRGATAAAALALGLSGLIGTWGRVARFICPSRAVADALPAGWPKAVVPNMVDPAPAAAGPGAAAVVYAGRLTQEKGVGCLAEAWRRHPLPPLDVYGEGPMESALAGVPGITLHGRRDHGQVLEAMAAARAVVVPSLWPEPFGRAAIEALACGTPVVATAAGALPELIEDGLTGHVVPADDPHALARAVQATGGSGQRQAARTAFERRFAAPVVAPRLVEVYRSCLP
ncbi:glycosyltransferase family 4 protein [Caenispirillum bisanense]|uniref:glycosyltransferase family 4 protein n=1 Tax=Caenispirillum bisanense TaxID=414052 RepID=UPI0031DC518B